MGPSGDHLAWRNMWTTHYGFDSISNYAANMRDLLPHLTFHFQRKIKNKKLIPEKQPSKPC